MSFFSEKIKEPSRTQIVARGLILDELIREDVMKELKEKFKDRGELIPSVIQFHVLEEPKPSESREVKEGEKKGAIISLKVLDFIELNHPSPQHYKDKVVVVTSNRNSTLEKFIK